MTQQTRPLVAIVGRPNVGKSTLFNRLSGQRGAIVSDVPGTTRDRVTKETEWGDHAFVLVDTGGLDEFPPTELWTSIRDQIQVAIDEADVIIMLVDVQTGVTAADAHVAQALRRSMKPVVLAANKADNETRETQASEFYEMGLGDPIPVSAYHNRGIDELMERVLGHFLKEPASPPPDADLRLAIIGRTNMGKSMLVNAITGQERAIVSEIPGTTRDSLDTLVTTEGGSVLLIDTAGIRRRGKINPGIERYSTLRAIRAIDRADATVLLLDASELATSQDSHIANYILEAYRGIVLAVNKWDLAPQLGLSGEDATRTVLERFKFAAYAPICFVSALSGAGIEEMLETVRAAHGQWNRSLPRYDLRRTVLNAVAAHPPSSTGRRSLKIFGVTQDQVGPPSFTFYVNRSDIVHFSYKRYLENALRAAYGFKGTPLRMRFKGRGEQGMGER
jgi:GTP-binding protein